jgi:hypothetical protein
MAMRTKMLVLVAAIAGLGLITTQGCFYSSSRPGAYGQQYGSNRTVCDSNGRNCMVCDANNRNCQRVGSQYGSNRTVCDRDGRNCVVCDSNNRNCERDNSQYGSSRGSSWGFWW